MDRLIARIKALAAPIGLGLFVIMAVAIGLVYFQQGGEQGDLRAEIDQQVRITSRARQSAEAIEARFQEVQDAIPSADLKETDVFEVVLDIAGRSGVAASIRLQSLGTRKVGKTDYRVLTFTVTGTGGAEEVDAFIEALDRGQTSLPTLVLEDLKVSGDEEATATIDIVVYTHAEGG